MLHELRLAGRTYGIKAVQRKQLIQDISGRIMAGQSQMANQDIDSLVG